DRREFTFRANELENRVPSARQLVYNDSRANEDGRLPDDTWIIPPRKNGSAARNGDSTPSPRPSHIKGEGEKAASPRSKPTAVATSSHVNGEPETLEPGDTWTLRPQDLADRFRDTEDTWYFPRVNGTFKERAGFHGCQMPEQLLGRIIRVCSNEGDFVVDPFSGSATTLAVAKKLGRRFVGFDLSKEYVKLGKKRLAAIHVGDPLEGAPEPLMSAPQTWQPRAAKGTNGHKPKSGRTGGRRGKNGKSATLF
ncbi:MAG TPA: site-specific DNA-methyltransferase, partial [Pirellulales bacterium]